YGGSGAPAGDLDARPVFHMGQPYSLLLNLPPLTGLVLLPEQNDPSGDNGDG
ncbi:MAG: hypothetical protein JNK31_06675, partial [Candidatus Competibacter sp.]|nr:hypothetical protein [Candidatus Competibacter sp.]